MASIRSFVVSLNMDDNELLSVANFGVPHTLTEPGYNEPELVPNVILNVWI